MYNVQGVPWAYYLVVVWYCHISLFDLLSSRLGNGWNIDPSFHSRVESTVTCVAYSQWKLSEIFENANQLAKSWCQFFRMRVDIDCLKKRKSIDSDYYIELLVRLKGKITKRKWQHMKKKKIIFHQDSALGYKSMKKMAKFNKLCFSLCPHPPYFLRSSLQWLLALCWSQKDAPRGKDMARMRK